MTSNISRARRRQFHRTALTLLTFSALLPATNPRAQQYSAPDMDVPFVVTPDNVVLRMLDMAQVSSADTVLDLGSGDGRIVITAALRYGALASGVEIDPNLVKRAQALAQRAGVEARTSFRTQDLFETDLSQASVITMYLLPDVNLALRPKLLALRPGVRLVSHDWDMGDWLADSQATIDAPEKALGLKKQAKLMLWIVPANVAGRHVGDGIELSIDQQYQQIRLARLQLPNQRFEFSAATVRGPTVFLRGTDAAGQAVTLACTTEKPAQQGMQLRWRLSGAASADRWFETRAAT